MADEAKAGLEVIRRKCLIGRRSDEELYFVLSLYSSYSSYEEIEMTGGSFFGVNKEFWMGIISVICSLFVIIIQIAPVFDHTGNYNYDAFCFYRFYFAKFDDYICTVVKLYLNTTFFRTCT